MSYYIQQPQAVPIVGGQQFVQMQAPQVMQAPQIMQSPRVMQAYPQVMQTPQIPAGYQMVPIKNNPACNRVVSKKRKVTLSNKQLSGGASTRCIEKNYCSIVALRDKFGRKFHLNMNALTKQSAPLEEALKTVPMVKNEKVIVSTNEQGETEEIAIKNHEKLTGGSVYTGTNNKKYTIMDQPKVQAKPQPVQYIPMATPQAPTLGQPVYSAIPQQSSSLYYSSYQPAQPQQPIYYAR